MTDSAPNRAGPPSPPRWVKALGIAFLAVLVLLAVAKVTGLAEGHSPSRHGAGASAPESGVSAARHSTPVTGR